jgi:hypothetical protein
VLKDEEVISPTAIRLTIKKAREINLGIFIFPGSKQIPRQVQQWYASSSTK